MEKSLKPSFLMSSPVFFPGRASPWVFREHEESEISVWPRGCHSLQCHRDSGGAEGGESCPHVGEHPEPQKAAWAPSNRTAMTLGTLLEAGKIYKSSSPH